MSETDALKILEARYGKSPIGAARLEVAREDLHSARCRIATLEARLARAIRIARTERDARRYYTQRFCCFCPHAAPLEASVRYLRCRLAKQPEWRSVDAMTCAAFGKTFSEPDYDPWRKETPDA